MKAGLYQKAGLDVQIVPTSSGTAATTSVVAGTYEIGKASLISVMVAHLRGLPIALVAGGAVWDPKVPYALVTSAWVDKLGGDSKTLKFVEIPNSVATAALASGQARVLEPAYSSISNHFMFGAYFVNTDWAKQHADAAKTFARVTYQAAAYTNTHHAETAAMMAEITKIPLAIFTKMDRVQSATSGDAALMQPLIDAAAKYHQIPRAFAAAELYLN